MARRYDARTTIFSPEGRLYQVEYAMEAISQAGTCMGVRTDEGIFIIAEKRVADKLLDATIMHEKIFKISNNILCAVAGITSDANVMIDELRQIAARYRESYSEDMPLEQLVRRLADIKQHYTQVGGKRPFGVSFLYAGWDPYHGFQMYQSDPSGNYTGWHATCIGKNHTTAVSHLKQEYKTDAEMTLDKAKQIAMKVLSKTLDVKPNVDKLEVAEMKMVDNKLVMRYLTNEEVQQLIMENEQLAQEQE